MDRETDIRWEQRFSNYLKALEQLSDAVLTTHSRSLNRLEKEGLIQRFEYTHKLAWKVMKDYFEHQGNTLITGSRDAIREAFQYGLITDGDSWMQTIKSHNTTSHTYDENVAEDIVKLIITAYYPLFLSFKEKMETMKQ